MKKKFAEAAASEAEKTLRQWNIKYRREKDGSLVVPGSINLSGKGLAALPDLSSVTVRGDFNCQDNQLSTLKGAPRRVGGFFYCDNNQLASLEGAPQDVGWNGWHHMHVMGLVVLFKPVFGGFYCTKNKLTSLAGGPAKFKELVTDFGDFRSWTAVPENLRSFSGRQEPPIKKPRGLQL